MRRTKAQAVLFAVGDSVLLERYAAGADASTRFLSFSITKSIVSTLIGIAVGEGLIGTLDDKIVRYLPEVAGSAYEKASIRDLLTMSSGSSFSEAYENPQSDIAAFIGVVNRSEGGLYDFARAYAPAKMPGKAFQYSSADTEILGELLRRVTKGPLAAYAGNKLWSKIGAEADALWMLDGANGAEIAAGGFAARARDFVRFGAFVADNGRVGDQQVLPVAWLGEATAPQRSYAGYGKVLQGSELGYGYLWWLRPQPQRMFLAMGIFGQFILIEPASHSVMVVLSAWDKPFEFAHYQETFELFDSLVKSRQAIRPGTAKLDASAGLH
jgi:CubicO group peptidase (beta-lactamase class C family)